MGKSRRFRLRVRRCEEKTVESCLWPFKAGTRRERWAAVAALLELWLVWSGLYTLAWLLKQQ